jgi:hypothetical protein
MIVRIEQIKKVVAISAAALLLVATGNLHALGAVSNFTAVAPMDGSNALVSLQAQVGDSSMPEFWMVNPTTLKRQKLPESLEFEHLTILDAFYHRQQLFAILQWQNAGAKLPQLYQLKQKQWQWIGEFGCREYDGVKTRGMDIIQLCPKGKSSTITVLSLKKAPLATKAIQRQAAQRRRLTMGKTTIEIKLDGQKLQIGKKSYLPTMFK